MANEAIGMIETNGLVALVQATDAMLKAASVEFVGWNKIGSGLVLGVCSRRCRQRARGSGCGEAAAGKTVGEVVSVHVIARPHSSLASVLPK
jgi:ethanolamine utilization protein EutM